MIIWLLESLTIHLAFDRVSYAIRELCSVTQQARAAFQYATLNIFQAPSRQQSQMLANVQPSGTLIAHNQIQTMRQQK